MKDRVVIRYGTDQCQLLEREVHNIDRDDATAQFTVTLDQLLPIVGTGLTRRQAVYDLSNRLACLATAIGISEGQTQPPPTPKDDLDSARRIARVRKRRPNVR